MPCCSQGWVCIEHPDQPWPHGECHVATACLNPECSYGAETLRRYTAHSDDHRINRLSTPICERCQTAAHVRCGTRHPMWLYFRCWTCGEVWSVQKPRDT